MKKSLFALFMLFATIGISFSQDANVVPGNIIVMLNASTNATDVANDLNKINVDAKARVSGALSARMRIYLLEFDETVLDRNMALRAVNRMDGVKIAQFNHVIEERAVPNDPQFSSLWNMQNTGQNGGIAGADISAVQAWDVTTGGLTAAGDTIVVAIVDGGFDLAQEDLNYWKNLGEIPGDTIDNDNNGYIDDYKGWNGQTGNDNIPVASHGTHVAGIAGAKGNNGIGVTGVNWNVKTMAVSYGSSGGSFEANVVASYSYILEQRRIYNETNGAQGTFVVATNSSFGINSGQPSAYPLWCAMYDSLGSVGILSAAATANSSVNVDQVGDIPTACPSDWLVTVTNTTNSDAKYGSAGFGLTTIDLGAPGTNITSTYPSNTYSTISGTSMASPHVAGAIALMYSVQCADFIAECKSNPAAAALKVKDSLLMNVDTIDALNGITTSGGRLNLNKAVRAIQHFCSGVSVQEMAKNNKDLYIKGIYPNPAKSLVRINYVVDSQMDVFVGVTNVIGQELIHVLSSSDPGANYIDLNISDLSSGVYLVRMFAKGKESSPVKLIVY